MKLDSNQVAYFNTKIGEVRTKVLEQKYEALRGRSIVPTYAGQLDEFAASISFESVDAQTSDPVFITSGSDLSKPGETSVSASKESKGFGAWALGYSYSYDEIAMASKFGLGLDQARANATRRRMEALIDTICATGNTQAGLKGLLNQTTGSGGVALTTSAGSYGTLSAAGALTGEQISDDVVRWVLGLVDTSRDNMINVRLVVPSSNFKLMNDKFFDRGGTSVTVLDDIKKRLDGILESVVPWNKAEGVGASSRNRMAAFSLADDAVALYMPRELTQTDAIDVPDQMRQKIVMHAKTGGVIVRETYQIGYRDIVTPS